jgi:hypothetical protein
VIAVILILLGIAAVAYGFGQLHGAPPTSGLNDQMTDATNDGTDFTSLFLIGAGAIVLLAGFGCLSASLSPKDDLQMPSSTGVTCPECGLLNEPGARTCESCGGPLRG